VAAPAAPAAVPDAAQAAAEDAAESAVASVVGLSAQLDAAQGQVDAARAAAAIALDTYEGQEEQRQEAQAAADATRAAAAQAEADLARERQTLAEFARESYVSGSMPSRLQSLVTSGSAGDVVDRQVLLALAADHRSDVLTRVRAVEEQAAAADAAAEAALDRAAQLARQAEDTLATAQAAEQGARRQAAALMARREQAQGVLQTALGALGSGGGDRAAALQADLQQALADSAARSRGAAVSSPGPPSATAVEHAIAAAQRWLGTPYAWGGGSPTGPSAGIGIDDGVVGFDCSGLTRYAYAQAGISIPRQSTVQYASLPPVPLSDLQRGDLVFWATDVSDPATVHHVALYLGRGQILEAPESGETVRVTAMRWAGFIGAVRPSA
jgi:cell wall-associated NlpC family hydrolase